MNKQKKKKRRGAQWVIVTWTAENQDGDKFLIQKICVARVIAETSTPAATQQTLPMWGDCSAISGMEKF